MQVNLTGVFNAGAAERAPWQAGVVRPQSATPIIRSTVFGVSGIVVIVGW